MDNLPNPARRKARSPKWNWLALIVALGTDRDIADRIVAAGFDPPPIKTIAGWRTRRSIPSKWAPLMIKIAIDDRLLKSVGALLQKAA